MATMAKDRPATNGSASKAKSKGFKRPIIEIIADLQTPVPPRLLKGKKRGGNQITYIPWYRVVMLMDFYAPGWEYEVTDKTITSKHVMLTVRVFINAQEGRFYREATGIEELNTNSFGDPTSNAESMALRRACAKWGLGLELYDKE